VKVLLLIVLGLMGLAADLQAQLCAVCNQQVGLEFYRAEDKVTNEQKVICDQCSLLSSTCYLCGLPVKNNMTRLEDGRVLCARDAKAVVLSEEEARRECAEASIELDRLFSRFMHFPNTNASLTIVDRTQMDQLLQTPGFDRQCPSVYGYVRSRVVAGGHWRHPISILSGLPKYRLMAVYAHEFGHAWARENVPIDREMDRDTEEGWCELIAYRLMERFNQQVEMNSIRNNLYTRGQFALVLEADNTYGFYRVMQWMKWGIDSRLQEEDPDRIRKINEKRQPSGPPVNDIGPVVVGPTPIPDKLTLLGISGAGRGQLALINDRAFGANESGRVRVGKTNVVIRCLEISDGSVVIEVDGTQGKQELSFKVK
jgi:hypothetical protein